MKNSFTKLSYQDSGVRQSLIQVMWLFRDFWHQSGSNHFDSSYWSMFYRQDCDDKWKLMKNSFAEFSNQVPGIVQPKLCVNLSEYSPKSNCLCLFSLVQTWRQQHNLQLPVSKLYHLGSLSQKRHWWLRETGDNTTQMIQEHNVGVQKFLQYLGHLFDGCGGFAREGLWWQCSSYLVFQKTLNWDCVIYHHWRNTKPSDERQSWTPWSKKS